jgi:hypothetical protein
LEVSGLRKGGRAESEDKDSAKMHAVCRKWGGMLGRIVSGSEGEEDANEKVWKVLEDPLLRRKRKLKIPWIVDVKVVGWEQKISFIQVGEEDDMQSALEKVYQLNVERIAFDVRRQVFQGKETVRQSICEGKARNDRVEFEIEGCPAPWEIGKVTRALEEMREYSRRGYKFDSDRGVSVKADGIIML